MLTMSPDYIQNTAPTLYIPNLFIGGYKIKTVTVFSLSALKDWN